MLLILTLTLHDPVDPAAAATPANHPLPMYLGPNYPYSYHFLFAWHSLQPALLPPLTNGSRPFGQELSASGVRPKHLRWALLPPTSSTPPTSVKAQHRVTGSFTAIFSLAIMGFFKINKYSKIIFGAFLHHAQF